ncbi:MAG: PSD1 and planctomycete cytochrome C domain-containing protein [Prosthecobacter sp.]|uniref:PSD1 and planctomycete cytochrome C domain-containing protein n=1 Tax=Prosthecobacter sp. TaxID=1965333 RepID=UPI002611BCE8|nr:PSD1 and planctomycete cytochrome C domain-containing protein [Prosthecobacter sp.]MCF7789109.1 PSD1 and planctomycete cytochrome C domain-containing protein [Prosthecobacter sp.]
MKPAPSIALAFALLARCAMAAAPADDAKIAFFEKTIRPILIKRCYECHSVESGKTKGGLSIDSREAILKGGDNGPALVAGNPEKSHIIESIRYQNQDLQMPPKGAMPAAEVKALEEWVKMGAPDPREAVATNKPSSPRIIDLKAGAKHWAFRPIAHPPVPKTDAANPIDAFISEKLAEKGLTLAAPADKRTLIRRATFDLTGLPPSPQEVNAFLADNSPDAFAKVIDRLLRSPQYGEKWGRHWLDVARYSDSNGLDENIALGTAWRYRDYVVQAINADKPFDQFLTEQIAGDLLEAKDLASRKEHVTATAFLNLGAKVLAEPDKEKLAMDVIDEQIDVTGRAFMGLTLGCARCHDHKFDPVPTADYYALAAIFKSTQSFSVDRIGALSTSYEAPMGSLEDFADVISSERILKDQKAAVAKAESAAITALRKEVRDHAVDYLMAAAKLPATPTLSQVRPVAEPLGLRAHILLNCRVYLAANETLPFFKPWQDALKSTGDVTPLRGYYTAIFAAAEKITPAPKAKPKAKAELADASEDSLLHQARAALDAPAGFLALPPEPMVLFPKDVAEKVRALKDTMMTTESNLPDLPTTLAVAESSKIVKELPIHIRGSHLALGKPVARGFIQVAQASLKTKPQFPDNQSGRLELARWLASPEHPLTSRVMVNRIWSWHFRQGIVPTTDNFGLLGQQPTHPALLDWLARWFTSNGWSLKDMHRLIMSSRTYQQSSATSAQGYAADPEDLLLHHFPVRRLEAEEIRDALLSVAGSLDNTIGGKTIPRRNREFVFNHTSKDFTSYGSTRRALYMPIIRNNLYDLFQQFDYPDPSTSTGLRHSSVVSPQALLLMNSDLATSASQAFAARVFKLSADKEARLRAAYRIAFAREATADDLRRAENYLTAADASLNSSQQDSTKREQEAWALLCQALMMSNEFIYLR